MFSVTDVKTELYHLLLLYVVYLQYNVFCCTRENRTVHLLLPYVVYLQYNVFCYRLENRTVPPIVTVCCISTI